MTLNMTNSYDITPSNDDDPISCPDDGDTSFEIDEPDDEEVFDDVMTMNKRISLDIITTIADAVISSSQTAASDLNATLTPNSRSSSRVFAKTNATTTTTTTSTAKDDIDIDDDGHLSDSSTASHTGSSTPTTADVADITAVTTSAHAQKMKRLSPFQAPYMKYNNNSSSSSNTAINIQVNAANNNGSIADDNLSASIATTTTELLDIDAMPSSSKNATTARSLSTAPPQVSPVPPPSQTTASSSLAPPSLRHHQHSSSSSLSATAAASATYAHPSAAAYHDIDAKRNPNEPSSSGHNRTLSLASYHSSSSQHPSQSLPSVLSKQPKQLRTYKWIQWMCARFKSSGIGEPSVYHALVVIFLEFFAWGLLTMPVISVLNQTFPDHTFLMNGLVMGIKGILSFLSAPLIGALSDIWGRKFFLLITVFFTCAPIPLMTINTWWFFAMISISGVFAVTFSVVFAYVADVTTVEERSRAYGLVSATFAASLVISPALGAVLMEMYSDTMVVALATAIAVLDVFFILVAVPESLPEKIRPASWGAPISWEQADPFAALRKVGTDHTILMQCVTVLLSYLPEAGQYSCIFVYLKLKMGFNAMEVAIFIAVVGILSISVQVTLGYLMRVFGPKRTIILGLVLEMMQLLWYGFGSAKWMMWAAGVLAALGSITYPAISAFVSIHSNADRQGAVQGMVTGMRGLCNGLGPAMFGVIFYLFNVDLNDERHSLTKGGSVQNQTTNVDKYAEVIPGPPFVFGAFMVILAILVAIFIPESHGEISLSRIPSEKKRVSVDVQYEIESGHKSSSALSPLMRSDSLAQL